MTSSYKCSESLEEGWASLQGLVSNLSKYLACVEVDKFEAAESEEALSKRGLELLETNQLWGGLVFVGLGPGQQELPKFVTYKIRIDADKVSRACRREPRPDPGGQHQALRGPAEPARPPPQAGDRPQVPLLWIRLPAGGHAIP